MKEKIITVTPEIKEKTVTPIKEVNVIVQGGTGTNDYEQLNNKPQINNIELVGNKTLEDLGINQTYTANDIRFEDGQTFQEKYNSGELTGKTGEQGIQGERGEQGPQGPQGETPQKGVDYFTETDKQEFVSEVEQNLTPKLNNKLDKNQGAENNGKFLGIGADGLVVPKDVPSTGGGDNNYLTVINEINVEEEVAVVKIDFTGDYDNYYVIGQLQNGDTGTIVLYQDAMDISGKTIALKFLDTYGNNNKTITFALRFERIKGENNNLLRLSGLYTNTSYIPSNKMSLIDTGYFEKYTSGDFLKKYTRIQLNGQFLSGNLKILGGN